MFKSLDPKVFATKKANNYRNKNHEFNELCAECGYPYGRHSVVSEQCPEVGYKTANIIPYRKPTKFNKRQTDINVFYKFLIENDAFIEYRHNVRVNALSHNLVNIFNESKNDWICKAFNWCGTNEGMDYWLALSVKWYFHTVK